jgi:2-methylcitrate dehydratase PrpD
VSKTPSSVVAPKAGLTSDLARRASELSLEDVLTSHVQRARHCLLDWFAVTIAGSREEAARIVCQAALLECEAPRVTLVGTSHRLGPRSAALVNGTACHALDYDDSSFWMTGHPSAAVVTPALAVGEARGASGATVTAAIIAGHDVAARIGAAVGKEHYLRGWHATGTLGAFAAAAAAGRVVGLDAEAMERALGLAATQAAGLKVSFGTMAKPLHAGRAAANGVMAALLAEQGFTAGLGAVEGHQGFASTQAPGFDESRITAELGDRQGIEGVLYKKHACCGGTHGAIDALQCLAAANDFVADDVERVQILVSDQMFDICCIPEPTVGIEGKFSLRHVSSLVLAGRSTGPSGFTDAAVADPELLSLRERVEVVPSGKAVGLETTAIVTLRSHEVLQADAADRRAARDDELPLEWEVLSRKAHDLASWVVGDGVVAELIDRVSHFESESAVADVLALTRTP